jgi:hypothetical protein
MKTEELKNIIKESITREIKKAILEGISDEVYIIKNKKGEPIEQFETEEEAQKALETYKKDNPDQELIIEPGEKLSFEELDKMSEKLENMENMNESTHKGHFTMEQVLKLAKKAGDVVPDAQDALEELCEMYGEKVPASRVFEILDDYDMPELKSKIKVKKAEPKEDMSMDEKLYGNQDKLDVDGDGEIEASDLAKLRAGKESEEEVEEGEDCMECGDKMYEGDQMCSECGGMMNEEGVCNECGGGMMNESKKKIRLTESELVKLIKTISESVPGLETYKRSHKGSGEINRASLSNTDKILKDLLSIDGNDNPEFPKQIGKGEKSARQNTSEEDDIVATNRGGGMEDLDYDIEPSKHFKDRLKMALTGDSKMGNSHDAANVIPSDLGEKMMKKAERKNKEDEKAPMYEKDPAPITNVNESVTKSNVLNEIKRMKDMVNYNKKTQ